MHAQRRLLSTTRNRSCGDDRRTLPVILVVATRPPSSWQLGDASAVGPLIAALGDGDWRVRERAAEALVQVGDPAVAR